MPSDYYTYLGKTVYNGDVANADDLNNINTSVDAAFEQVEVDIDNITSNFYFNNVSLLKGSTLDVGVIYKTKGYLSPGDGGEATYLIVDIGTYGEVPDEYENFTVNGGTQVAVNQRVDKKINVRQFGAVGNGTVSNTIPINKAAESLRNSIGDDSVGQVLLFPPGLYRADVNLTDIRTKLDTTEGYWTVEGYGATIIGDVAGKVVVDLMESLGGRIKGLSIYGDVSRKPRIGLQLARGDDRSSDNNTLEDVRVDGHFTLTAFYNLASERFAAHGCQFTNNHSSTSAYALIIDGKNKFNGLSDYWDQELPVDGVISCLSHLYTQCTFKRGDVGDVVFLTRSSRLTMINCYVAGTEGVGIRVFLDGGILRNLDLDVHMENEGLTSNFYFDVEAGTSTGKVWGFRWRDNEVVASESLFFTNASSRTQLRDFDVQIPTVRDTLVYGVFEPVSKFNIHGKLSVHDSNLSDGINVNRFDGDITVADNTDIPALPGGGTFDIRDDGANPIVSRGLYEITQFTPAISFDTPGDLSVDYSIQSAQYSRFNQFIHFKLFLSFTPTFSTASGTFMITGLPEQGGAELSSLHDFVNVGQLGANFSWPATSEGYVIGRVGRNDDFITLRSIDEGGEVVWDDTNLSSGLVHIIQISGIYTTD